MAACRPLSALAKKAVADARHYFAANRTRAKFRDLGLHTGSDTVKSRCKRLGLTQGPAYSGKPALPLSVARLPYLLLVCYKLLDSLRLHPMQDQTCLCGLSMAI